MAAETICMVSLQKSKIFTSDVWLKKIFFPADIIYNKGFTMVNRTADSFPEDWSYEKMCALTEEGERRKQKSKWMLLIIIPLMFTFMFDMIDLFILDSFRYLFN